MSIVPGLGWGDLVNLATTAWNSYQAIRGAPELFKEITNEFGGLTMCIQCMKDDDIEDAILVYAQTDVHRQRRLKDLVKNLTSAIVPMDELLKKAKKHFGFKSGKFTNIFQAGKFGLWSATDIQDVRNRLVVHTASLNIFLTRLTHFSVYTMSKSIQAPLAALPRAQRAHTAQRTAATQHDDGLDGIWAGIGRSLVTGKHGKDEVRQGVQHFREEIRQFTLFLLDRGPPPRPATVATRKRQYDEIREHFDAGPSGVDRYEARMFHGRDRRRTTGGDRLRTRSYVERKKEESAETYEATERGNGEGLRCLFRSIGETNPDETDTDDEDDPVIEDGEDSDDSIISGSRPRPYRRPSPEAEEDEIVVVGGSGRGGHSRPHGTRTQSSPGPYPDRPPHEPVVVTITPSKTRPSPPTSPRESAAGLQVSRHGSDADNGMYVVRKKIQKYGGYR